MMFLKDIYMKRFMIFLLLFSTAGLVFGQAPEKIKLNPPDLKKGLPVMQALEKRASATEFDTTMLRLQDLSDLMWAANGINRPENGKRTAPSARNSQDIDLYACLPYGTYLYEPKEHSLKLVAEGDHRPLAAGSQAHFAKAPVICLLVSDISRFQGSDDSVKLVWAAMDGGIVSQNIGIFCAGTGLKTRPRAWMEKDKLREALHLRETQHPILNNPVSY